jgi:hypothetical protein
MTSYELSKWKPVFKKGDYFSMVITASRNSGKTYLIKHLLDKYLVKLYDIIIFVSDSPDTAEEFKHISKAIFLTKMNFNIINKIAQANKERDEPLRTLLVYDDKIGKETKYDDQLMQLFTRGRHLNLSIIFASQSKKLMDTTWLNNSDYIILLKQNSAQQKKTILENVLIGSIDMEDEKEERNVMKRIMMKYIGKKGDAIVINNKEQTNNNLFYYRAP